jgi:hypothetical protein
MGTHPILNSLVFLAGLSLFVSHGFGGDAGGGKTWDIHGESLNRFEYWNWFGPASDFENEYDYVFSRNRLSLTLKDNWYLLFVQGQYTQFGNLPGDAVAPPPVGAMGVGASYFQHSESRSSHKIFLKSAYIDFMDMWDTGISSRLGRFDYQDGLEVLSGNPTIDWLKRTRIAERLIGPFGWSAYTRSYDGGWIKYDSKSLNVTTFFSHPTQGGFEESAGNTIGKIDLAGVTLTLKPKTLIPDTEERLFYFYYDDERAVTQRVDNSGIGTAGEVDISIHTFGGHIASVVDAGTGQFDTILWGAYQTGDWYTQDHDAWALDTEAGYQFKTLPWQLHLRAGYFIGSGDDDPTDTRHETFYQMLPTARLYAYFPLYNLMNIEDTFAQIIARPSGKLTLRSDWHLLRLAEREDRWYSGAGATQEEGTIFGYAGRSSNGKDDLGQLVDTTLTYTLNPNVSLVTYYGHFFGGDVIEQIYASGDEADLGYVELLLKF